MATHILARARFAAAGRFGLRITLDGIATPAFGDRGEVLRMSGTWLVRERQEEDGAHTGAVPLAGTPLEELARFAGTDLSPPFDAGSDAPPLGDPSAPLEVDPDAAGTLLAWYRLGASSLDRVLPRLVSPSVIQLWPEHFDVGLEAVTGSGRVNLGASPGDAAIEQPYLYVGPWNGGRPGEPGYWNADFGAVLTRADVLAESDPMDAATAFLERGLNLLG